MTNITLSNGGKIGAAITNYKKREKAKQAERRTEETPILVTVKCPACWILHKVLLPPSMVEKGKLARIYCPVHKGRRNISLITFGTEARV